MAMNSSTQRPPNARVDTTPGAFPASPAPDEPPAIVSSQLSLSQAVHERRAEYTRPKRIKVKVGTWNVASLSGTEKDIGAWFVDGKGVSEYLSGLSSGGEADSYEKNAKAHPLTESVESQEARRSKKKPTVPENDPGTLPGGLDIGIYALGLQEIVDVSSVTEALRPSIDPHPAKKWKQSIAEALPPGYQMVAEQQLIGLYLVVYASGPIAPTVSSVSTTSVGTGLAGYMGNKGAVTARIILGETTRMVFINCHLSAGAEKGSVERRNWDASQIQSRTKFDPVYDGGGVMEEFGEGIGDEDFAFWFGDLNYRLEDIPAEDVRRLLMLHTKNEYGKPQASKQKIENELKSPETSTFQGNLEAASHSFVDDGSFHTAIDSSAGQSVAPSTTLKCHEPSDPSTDPTSLKTTLSSLLTHDQLHGQMRARKAFHDGWREGPIDFLPTYKYDVGSVAMFDSSEKRRGPSWCDRILFRTRRDKLDFEEKLREEETAKQKDNEMKLRGVVQAAADEAVLFDYDPETDGADDGVDGPAPDPEVVLTKAGFEDKLHLDYYTSHQRVISSDHKPLDAVFTLDYDAVDLGLKAQVHQEVARELDKAENEGRPVVTIVVDHHRDSDITNSDPARPKFEGVDFGDVKYDHPKIRNVTIANTGRVPAIVGFVDRSTNTGQPGGVAPSWLSIRFDRPSIHQSANSGGLKEYSVQPGDALNVELTLHITDIDFVRRLSEGEENLEDVLVLRIQNGRDYFLPLRANWLQSAFGRSIERLVRIPEGGVRRLQHQKPEGSRHSHHSHHIHHDDKENDAVKWSAPRELFRLTEAIESLVERSLAEWGMKGEEGKPPWEIEAGWPFAGWCTDEKERGILRERVREGLDTNQPFAELFALESGSVARLEAMAETLVHFLKNLQDGIITEELWVELEKGLLERERKKTAFTDEEERMWILDTLSSSPVHSVSFTFITFMLSRIANEIVPIQQQIQRRGTATSFDEMEAVRKSKDDPLRTRRREVNDAYAAIFADAMIRLPASITGKAMKASDARKKRIVDVFLRAGPGDDP